MTSTTTCDFKTPTMLGSGAGQTFQYASSTCVTISPDPATTTTASISYGFTYGEIVIGLFLFFLVLMTFFGGIINHVAGVRLRDFRKNDD